MTNYDTWTAFRQLATETAGELGRRRGETWTVTEWHEDHAHPAATLAPLALHGPEHARLYMQHGFDATGKVTVKGLWPGGNSYGAPSRNVDPARGARAIASAADTYVLAAGYLDQLPEKVTRHQAAIAAQTQRAGIMARFAALLDTEPPGDEKLSLNPYLPMRGEVSVDHHTEEGEAAPRVSLEMHGLDVETALAMIEVFAASGPARARCCLQFGLGHDARLARLGCLRAAERDRPPTYAEGDALFSLYRMAGTSVPWETWLDNAEIHAAWR